MINCFLKKYFSDDELQNSCQSLLIRNLGTSLISYDKIPLILQICNLVF